MTAIAASKIATIGPTIGTTLPNGAEVLITDTDHPDLVAMYTMDNISGTTLVDESPNNEDATIVGTVPAISGHIGDALQFPGTSGNHVVLTNALMGVGDYCICMWVDFNTLKAVGRVLGIGQGGTPGNRNVKLIFENTVATINLIVATGAATFTTIASVGTAELTGYHFFIIEGTPTSTEMFKDDVSILSQGAGLDTSRATTSVAYGNDRQFSGAVNAHFDGDQLRAFNRKLTAQEKTDLFNGGAGA
jgi:hypothetical protein